MKSAVMLNQNNINNSEYIMMAIRHRWHCFLFYFNILLLRHDEQYGEVNLMPLSLLYTSIAFITNPTSIPLGLSLQYALVFTKICITSKHHHRMSMS
jgi:hypothetical protein